VSNNKKEPLFNESKCVLCLSCIDVCKYNAVRLIEEKIKINGDNCTYCLDCVNSCPCDAITES